MSFSQRSGGFPCDGFRLLSRSSQCREQKKKTHRQTRSADSRGSKTTGQITRSPSFSPHSATAFCRAVEHHDAAVLRPVAQGAWLLSFLFFFFSTHHHHKLRKSRARCQAGQAYIPAFAVRLSSGNVTPYKVICKANLAPHISHLFIITLCHKQRQCLTRPAGSTEVTLAGLMHSSLCLTFPAGDFRKQDFRCAY